MFVFNVLAIESDKFAKSELWIWALISLVDKVQRETSIIKHTESIEIKTNQLFRERRWFLSPETAISNGSDQITSVAQSCPTLCDAMNRSTPGLPVHHQLPELTQTHVHRVSDVIQPSHPLSSTSPLAPKPSQHQSLFQWVNSWHEVAKVLEFQL